ncbi:extracellular alkaline serine protease [Colletotrichum eremochloae]|nr:extracellular alkaline serine protease [Colletotrichum eremochloae]
MDDNLQQWGIPKSREPRRFKMNPAGPIQKRKHNEMQPDLVATTEISPAAHEQTPKRQKTSEDWFDRLDYLNEVLSAQSGENDYKKVRVAVLDTGIEPDAARTFEIQDRYQDFTDHSHVTMRDDTGHGTSIVELICKVCEPAEIYVARVWESDRATSKTVDSTIKALEWAISNSVDIICMAFGFTSSEPKLRDILKSALSSKILVFAAASNHGNLSGVAYPAIWSDYVFGIFSTNAMGLNSHQINPTGCGRNNFAILGEGVKLSSGKTVDGTSYSTAIACGLAARLLDFAGQMHLSTQKYGDFRGELKDKMGMERVFRSLSKDSAGYNCIIPWSLLPEHLIQPLEGLSDEGIQTARELVFHSIFYCLKNH